MKRILLSLTVAGLVALATPARADYPNPPPADPPAPAECIDDMGCSPGKKCVDGKCVVASSVLPSPLPAAVPDEAEKVPPVQRYEIDIKAPPAAAPPPPLAAKEIVKETVKETKVVENKTETKTVVERAVPVHLGVGTGCEVDLASGEVVCAALALTLAVPTGWDRLAVEFMAGAGPAASSLTRGWQAGFGWQGGVNLPFVLRGTGRQFFRFALGPGLYSSGDAGDLANGWRRLNIGGKLFLRFSIGRVDFTLAYIESARGQKGLAGAGPTWGEGRALALDVTVVVF